MLCVSGYAAGDYNSIGLFKNNTYQFGYFPVIKKYDDVDGLIASKKHNSIIWVGRLIEWKHPDHAIEIARRLRKDGYDFTMEMIGNGPLKDELHRKLDELDLNAVLTIDGSDGKIAETVVRSSESGDQKILMLEQEK